MLLKLGKDKQFPMVKEDIKMPSVFNCGRMEHLRRYCIQAILRNNLSSGNGKNKRTQPIGICRRCGKSQYWTNEWRSTKDSEDNPIPLGIAVGEPL